MVELALKQFWMFRESVFRRRILRRQQKQKTKHLSRGHESPSSNRRMLDEWQRWQIRAGISPDSHGPMSRSGIYTDFD